MLNISKVSYISDLRNATLRDRAERGHCAKSLEFLASLNGEEAGLLSYEDWSSSEQGFIYEIFVLPSFRLRGIGESLLSYAENCALQFGCKSIRLKPYSLDQKNRSKSVNSLVSKGRLPPNSRYARTHGKAFTCVKLGPTIPLSTDSV